MPSTGGSRSGSGGDDTGHGSGVGSSSGGGRGGGRIGMFGPMGLKGYRRQGQKIDFSHPSTWGEDEKGKARESY